MSSKLPGADVAVRNAAEEDDRALGAIDLATWSAAVSPGPPPLPGTPFFGGSIRPQDVLVAEARAGVVGYVALVRATPLPANAHVLELRGLAVAHGSQGAGVGRRLLDAAVEEARDRGAQRLRLRVLADNAPARRLYVAAGFVQEGVLRGEFAIGGALVDDVLMARGL